MTAQKKQPTNADIYRKLDSMDIRIGALESWKIAEDAARKAINEYRRDENRRNWGQVAKDLLPLIAALIILTYALANHLGK